MSTQPAPAHLEDPLGQQAADTQFYREVLHDLIIMGTDIARIVHAQAAAAPQPAPQPPAPNPAPPPDLTIPFDRIARVVRRSVALARSLSDPAPPARDPAQHRAAARKRLLREVEDTIQRTANEGDHAETLNAELRDRLDAPDLDDDLTNRPVAEVITEICRDLGLDAFPGTHPWKRRTPADIVQLCARAAAPSRPRQPGPASHAPEPGIPHRLPDDPHRPNPAATPRAAPAPAATASALPDDPAEAIALILRHSRHPGPPQPPAQHPTPSRMKRRHQSLT